MLKLSKPASESGSPRSREDSRPLRRSKTIRATSLRANKAEPLTVPRRRLRKRQLFGAVALRRRLFVCATRSTANSSPRNHASSAAARPPKRTTFALLNRVRSTARSATSTRSRSAAFIIASCTDMAMKLHGGPARTSIRYPWRSSYGDARGRFNSRKGRIRTFFLRQRNCESSRVSVFDPAGFGVQRRLAFKRAFARTISFHTMGARATFRWLSSVGEFFWTWTSCPD